MNSATMNFCVFAGSRTGADRYRDAAAALGTALAERSIGIVYGGGAVGLMGVLADAALAAGGQVTGVIPRFLCEPEVAHPSLTQLHVTHSMHERKQMMADLSHAYIALPGGIGTLEETFEAWTWLQLGVQHKPIGILNVAGFYDSLLGFLDELVEQNFVGSRHRSLLRSADNVPDLLDQLQSAAMPAASDSDRMDRS